MGKRSSTDHSNISKGNRDMKIGINGTFLNEKPTGAGLFTKEVYRTLLSLNREILLFSPVSTDKMPSNSIYKVPEMMKGSRRLLNSLYRFFYINTILPGLCKLKGVDVLYCPILEFPFISHTPTVVHIHDLHFIHFSSEFGFAAPRLKFSLKIIRRIVKRVIVSSEFIKNELIRLTDIRESQIDVVPLAYNNSVFKPMPLEIRKDFLNKNGLRENYILFVGSLFPYKNLKTLVDAFLRIKDKIPHSLVVVGRREFSLKPPVKDERITYMDYVDGEDLPFFYSCADLFVYPSLKEGFGIAPLEAMACGTPVISSNGGSLPEVVGDAAILFDPEDSESLSELIINVINNEGLRKELIEKGFKNIKNFSWRKTAEGILASCERTLKEKG
ncbi:MAG: glycosyltransferase family 1 protein [Nitrospirota bacterium]